MYVQEMLINMYEGAQLLRVKFDLETPHRVDSVALMFLEREEEPQRCLFILVAVAQG